MNYYEKIKNVIEEKEINDKVRYIESNKETVKTYFEIGKLLVEAQGGEKRAKYGDGLIKKWSKKFASNYGKNYDYSNLTKMRKFYINFKKVATVWQQFNLSWSHYRCLLKFDDENERNYYINLCAQNNLSVRKLSEAIKEKSFDRLSYADKKNVKLTVESNNGYSIKDMLLDPILVNIKKSDNLSEKVLKKYILKELEHFFLQLGSGFSFVGSEYKIKFLESTFYIDLLLFNYNLNSFIVIELKLNKSNYKDINQVLFYKNAVDKVLKKDFHNKTIGVLVSKKNNKFILEYISDENLFLTTYKINN